MTKWFLTDWLRLDEFIKTSALMFYKIHVSLQHPERKTMYLEHPSEISQTVFITGCNVFTIYIKEK